MMLNSSIYAGWVAHSRRVPSIHRFRYRVWWMLVDLDELARLDRSLRFFSYNRPNLFALYDSDYGYGTGSLRAYVKERLAAAGLSHADARIDLLTMPRLCGYTFNPLSVYFCRDHTGRLGAIIYEVHNTFGERHSYIIEANDDGSGITRQSTKKAFYVSPFMDMSQDYNFRVRSPGESLAVAITGSQHGEAVIHTALHGAKRTLTSAGLLLLFISYPLLTLKVIGAIHWEALRLWLKGIGIKPRQPVSGHGATKGYSATPVQGDNG